MAAISSSINGVSNQLQTRQQHKNKFLSRILLESQIQQSCKRALTNQSLRHFSNFDEQRGIAALLIKNSGFYFQSLRDF